MPLGESYKIRTGERELQGWTAILPAEVEVRGQNAGQHNG
jgi:hypothetical protein